MITLQYCVVTPVNAASVEAVCVGEENTCCTMLLTVQLAWTEAAAKFCSDMDWGVYA